MWPARLTIDVVFVNERWHAIAMSPKLQPSLHIKTKSRPLTACTKTSSSRCSVTCCRTTLSGDAACSPTLPQSSSSNTSRSTIVHPDIRATDCRRNAHRPLVTVDVVLSARSNSRLADRRPPSLSRCSLVSTRHDRAPSRRVCATCDGR